MYGQARKEKMEPILLDTINYKIYEKLKKFAMTVATFGREEKKSRRTNKV